jgi:hypothetical protein
MMRKITIGPAGLAALLFFGLALANAGCDNEGDGDADADANGVKFEIRDVNQCHYDFSPDIAYASMNRAQVNAVRISIQIWQSGIR